MGIPSNLRFDDETNSFYEFAYPRLIYGACPHTITGIPSNLRFDDETNSFYEFAYPRLVWGLDKSFLVS